MRWYCHKKGSREESFQMFWHTFGELKTKVQEVSYFSTCWAYHNKDKALNVLLYIIWFSEGFLLTLEL